MKNFKSFIALAAAIAVLSSCSNDYQAEQTPVDISSTKHQLISSNLAGTIVRAKGYLVWIESDNGKVVLYDYDIARDTHFLISEINSRPPFSLTSDGNTVFWVESGLDKGSSTVIIQSYDLEKKARTVVFKKLGRIIGDIAVDGGTIYYFMGGSNQNGLYALNTHTGITKLISYSPRENMIVVDGIMLWIAEEQTSSVDKPGSLTKTIHLAKLDGTIKDNVIAETGGCPISYERQGDIIIYSACVEALEQVYVFNLSSGTTRALTTKPSLRPSISGARISWIENGTNSTRTSSLQVADSSIKANDMSANYTIAMQAHTGIVDAVLLSQSKVAVSINNSDKPGLSLYIVDLDHGTVQLGTDVRSNNRIANP